MMGNRIRAGKVVILILVAVASLNAASAGQSIVYVDATSPPGGDGTSWGLAFDEFYQALDVAQSGDSVWVAAGTYSPEPNGGVPSPLTLRDGVAYYGGFAGDEISVSQRDWEANPTILSGDMNQDDSPQIPSSRDDNAYHVLGASLTGPGTRHDGFTITGGYAREMPGATDEPIRGGGIFFNQAELTIANCLFSGNTADVSGGGLACRDSVLAMFNVTFHENHALAGGGAWTAGGCITFDQCTFTDNLSDSGGGGLLQDPIQRIPNCSSLTNCVFRGNRAVLPVGGGGALLSGDTMVVNCVFDLNVAGGVLFIGTVHAINCSFVRNEGYGMRTEAPSYVAVTNSIFWGNRDGSVYTNPPDPFGTLVYAQLDYCDIEGGFAGTGVGNINVDPVFVQSGTGDYRLTIGSPCVNAGDSSAVPLGITSDLLGNPRIIGAAVDMGALEGEYEPGAPAASDYNIDIFDTATLVPNGGSADPVENTQLFIGNISAEADRSATVIQYDTALPTSNAGGFSELGSILEVVTDVPEGQMVAIPSIVFTAADLGGVDPLDVDLTWFDEDAGEWKLAAEGNHADSSGHDGPLGDRVITTGATFSNAGQAGDYGVHWNAETQRGVV